MIQLQKADSVFQVDQGWLKSRFYYSFADYYDPNNVSFGPMRVLNDDIVQAGRGFGRHPHREMEIVSIVLSGHLAHEDSKGNQASTTYGQIQRMSAGTGILHSEMNPSETEAVSLLQMWFTPEQSKLEPSYEHTSFDLSAMKNRLLPVVARHSSPGIAQIHQDLTIYLTEMEAGQQRAFTQSSDRRVFLFVIDGQIEIEDQGTIMERRDSARIEQLPELNLIAKQNTRLMLIDLP